MNISLFKKNKYTIKVEHVTGNGVRTKTTTFTKSPVQKNQYNVFLGPSEYIRVTVEEKR